MNLLNEAKVRLHNLKYDIAKIEEAVFLTGGVSAVVSSAKSHGQPVSEASVRRWLRTPGTCPKIATVRAVCAGTGLKLEEIIIKKSEAA